MTVLKNVCFVFRAEIRGLSRTIGGRQERSLHEKANAEEKRSELKKLILDRFNFIVGHKKPKEFLEYLCEAYGLKDTQEAKNCIFEILVDAGHPEDKLKKIPMLK